jgi:hypothetical protein
MSTDPWAAYSFAASQVDKQVYRRESIFDAGKGDLFYTLTRKENNTMPKTSVLNIATLQHIVLRDIQHDIACYVECMYRTSQFKKELQGFTPLAKLLSAYCRLSYNVRVDSLSRLPSAGEAVRNLDLMTECASRGYDKDPFLMRSSRALERQTMETVGLVPNHVLPAGPLPLPRDHKCPQLRQTGRNAAIKAAYKRKRLLRFSMAALGGLLLMVPVVVMATVPGLVSSLVTTCIATLVFAFLVAWRTELGPNEVLATTAAYAAVLVVFVGTSISRRSYTLGS